MVPRGPYDGPPRVGRAPRALILRPPQGRFRWSGEGHAMAGAGLMALILRPPDGRPPPDREAASPRAGPRGRGGPPPRGVGAGEENQFSSQISRERPFVGDRLGPRPAGAGPVSPPRAASGLSGAFFPVPMFLPRTGLFASGLLFSGPPRPAKGAGAGREIQLSLANQLRARRSGAGSGGPSMAGTTFSVGFFRPFGAIHSPGWGRAAPKGGPKGRGPGRKINYYG
jgi:hypothetical protein